MAPQKIEKKPVKVKDVEGKDPETGKFVSGNRWWLARATSGPNPKFKTSGELLGACLEYLAYVQDNPLLEEKVFHTNGLITKATVTKMRAMTLDGLCLFLDISFQTWDSWRTSRPDLSDVITRIERTIRDQKFSGAAADLLNPLIIARDLGLRDKQDVDHTGQLDLTVITRKIVK